MPVAVITSKEWVMELHDKNCLLTVHFHSTVRILQRVRRTNHQWRTEGGG